MAEKDQADAVLSRRRASAPDFVLEINKFKVIIIFPEHNWDRQYPKSTRFAALAGGLCAVLP